jgi:hypothetical protein
MLFSIYLLSFVLHSIVPPYYHCWYTNGEQLSVNTRLGRPENIYYFIQSFVVGRKLFFTLYNRLWVRGKIFFRQSFGQSFLHGIIFLLRKRFCTGRYIYFTLDQSFMLGWYFIYLELFYIWSLIFIIGFALDIFLQCHDVDLKGKFRFCKLFWSRFLFGALSSKTVSFRSFFFQNSLKDGGATFCF